jgi:hypothetical protein
MVHWGSSISVGETAEIILWGGGPPGQEVLQPTYRPGAGVHPNDVMYPDTNTTLGPHERLLKWSLTEPGEIEVTARVGDKNGREYVQAMTLVVLPRRPSSVGPEHLIIASPESYKDALNKADKNDPKAAVYSISSYAALEKLFRTFRYSGRKISKLEFDTHGFTGGIVLGNDGIMADQWRWMKGKGYEQVFPPGARVFFSACNVAEGSDGIDFLIEFGKTFFLTKEGSVGASDSLGLGVSPTAADWGLGGKIYHLWGNTVRVYFEQGGRYSVTSD